MNQQAISPKMPRLTLVGAVAVGLWIGLLQPGDASAAFQRMGIAAGSYRLAAHGSRAVPAFCYDFTRDSPRAGDHFTEVLTPNSRATVTIGAQRMSLQEALQSGKLAIDGTQVTFARMMAQASDPAVLAREPPEVRAEMQTLAAEWKRLPPAQKAAIERRFRAETGGAGDHTHLQLVNKTNLPVTVSFEQNAVFGGRDDAGTTIAANSITRGRPQEEIQKRIWIERNKEHQSLLADAGYLTGAADGLPFRIKSDVRTLQREYGLDPTAQIDPKTERVLHSVAQDHRDVAGLNAVGGANYGVVLVEGLPQNAHGNALYRLSIGTGQAVYADTIDDMQAQAEALLGGRSPARLYLVPRNLSDDRVVGLAASLKTHNTAFPASPDVRLLQGAPHLADDAFFGMRVSRIDDDGPAVMAAAADGAPRYRKSFNAIGEDGAPKARFTIISTAAELIDRLLANIRLLITQMRVARDAPPATAVSIVNAALEKTRREMNLSPEEFRKRVQVEMGSTQIAELLRAVGTKLGQAPHG